MIIIIFITMVFTFLTEKNKNKKETLQGNATLKHIVLETKELCNPWMLIQIWSKSVDN